MTDKKTDDVTTNEDIAPPPIPGIDPLKHEKPSFTGDDDDLPLDDPQMGVAIEQS